MQPKVETKAIFDNAGAGSAIDTMVLDGSAPVLPRAAASALYRPLGFFRFCLALLVVLQHFQHLLPPARRAIFSHIGFGAIAVCVFFAVSGFVVAEAVAVFYAERPGAFLANRALRMVPPYVAALALAVFVHAALWQSGHLVLWDYTLIGSPLAPVTLLSGVLGLVPGFNPHWFGQDFEFIPFVWTLRMEVAFYLVTAGTLAATVKLRAEWPRATAIVAGLLISAAFLQLSSKPGALSTAPMFLVGVSMFLFQARPGRSRAVVLLVSIVLAAAGFVSWRQHGAPVMALQVPLLAMLLALFAWLVSRRLTAGPRKRLDRRLGDLSYPLYLNHYAVGVLATSLAPRPSLALYAGGVMAAVLLAACAERLVDRPLRRARDRIRSVMV
jgi:peptidoglycan/LPS O-acetylase OafA/YrhL